MKIKTVFIILLYTALPIQAQEIRIVSEDMTQIIQTGNKYALKNYKNELLLSDLDSIGENPRQGVYVAKKQNKYGVFSLFGKEIVPIQYDKVASFYSNFWAVEKKGKKGIYHRSGSKKLPAIWDEIEFTWQSDAEFIVKKDNKYGLYNAELEEVLAVQYDEIKVQRDLITLVQKEKKTYLIDGQLFNKDILDDNVFHTYDVHTGQKINYYIFKESNAMGIMDEKGKIILKPSYATITPKHIVNKDLKQELFLFVEQNNQWGLADMTGQVILPPTYSSLAFSHPNYLIVGTTEGKQFYDLTTKKVIQGISFDTYNNPGKYTYIERNGKYTAVNNTTMQQLYPFRYEELIYLENMDAFCVKQNNKYGVVDLTEKEMVPIVYDSWIIFTCGNKAIVQKEGLFGIIDDKNKLLLPFAEEYLVAYSTTFQRQIKGTFDLETLDCELNVIQEK